MLSARVGRFGAGVLRGGASITGSPCAMVPSMSDSDIVRWSQRQATLLRERAAGRLVNDAELDWSNIAEEIESVGISQKREVRSRLARICQLLPKWAFQPELRSRSWRATIAIQRRELKDVLKDSPALGRSWRRCWRMLTRWGAFGRRTKPASCIFRGKRVPGRPRTCSTMSFMP